ncbi:hypothetical protein Barb7_01638 [Bacteroidales bacterium Barb7]|nr:hypothetical protein Barb7_01638 [Bacteroidales bacterium Barb7]
MFGLSLRQGPHHDAQKSIRTQPFPRREERVISSPSGVKEEKSGAG